MLVLTRKSALEAAINLLVKPIYTLSDIAEAVSNSVQALTNER